MTINHKNHIDLESRLNEVVAENDLLLNQLHYVQEEIERYYFRNKSLEKGALDDATVGAVIAKNWVDNELPDVMAESRRLRALVDVQREIYQIETQNALNVKLGNLLIEGADSPTAILTLPSKIAKIWRAHSRAMPPKSLGGKGFDNVVAAYSGGGFDAVEKMLNSAALSPVMRANGYTALARNLMHRDRINAAEAARRAHTLDPKPYRLKWLAFRLHEAGDFVRAEAMLDILPANVAFSDSETRQANQLRFDANEARISEARLETGFLERRDEIKKKLENLVRDCDEKSRLVAERDREIETLKQAKALLERNKSALTIKHEEAAQYVIERGREIEALKKTRTQLERDKSALTDRYEKATRHVIERGSEIEALKKAKALLERDKFALTDRCEEAARRLIEQGREIDTLEEIKTRLELEKSGAEARYKFSTEQLIELRGMVEVLKSAKIELSQEKLVLVRKVKEFTRQLTESTQAVDVLKRTKTKLKQEKMLLAAQYEKATKLAIEHSRGLEALRRAAAQLEQEKVTQLERHRKTVRQVASCAQEIEALKQTKARLEKDKLTLARRCEEVVSQMNNCSREIAALQHSKEQLELDKHALIRRSEEADAFREANVQLEQDRQTLARRYDEAAKQGAGYAQEIEALKQARVRLEHEKLTLLASHDDAVKLASDRLAQLNELHQQIENRQACEVELTTRQQLMQEEMVRAEAQLDLIKEVFLREPRL
nr:hypothetical protein [Burkholderia ambifaria]